MHDRLFLFIKLQNKIKLTTTWLMIQALFLKNVDTEELDI